jgi:spermidine synthase
VPALEERRQALTLLGTIFLVAACGLTYELLMATVSSYLLGSSVTQFSLCIGIFLGSMGLGSHLSQRLRDDLLRVFLAIEIVLGLLGGVSVALLFWTYPHGLPYYLVLYGLLSAIGTLTGLELPLLTRLLKRYGSLRTVLAQALAFDYLGALVGSILFPLLLLPTLGLMRTACLLGLVNLGAAIWNIRVFGPQLPGARAWLAGCGVFAAVLVGGFVYSLELVSLLETRLYEDENIYTEQTPYQRIVLTRWGDDVRLFLNGHLQCSSTDEYRYHEALVHPALSRAPVVESVLILGGGDGLAVREVLKYPNVRQITLVDIDPRMTALACTFPDLVALNRGALTDPRVRVVNTDAFVFLQREAQLYEIILADLPDPSSDVLAKLYSVEFYRLIQRHLTPTGLFATQAASPFFARDAFWCIQRTIAAAGLKTAPYRAYVPSFGEWGFVLAARHALPSRPAELRVPTRYLTSALLGEMFTLSRDISAVPVEVSTLDRPLILNYYVNGYQRWARHAKETAGPDSD